MKISPYLLWTALAFSAAPSLCRANYMPAEMQLKRLESVITTLTPAQQRQALQIFQNLTDIMNSIPADERPQKGMQSRQDARAAIRAILTPDQQKVYDATPGGMGGGSTTATAAARVQNAKIRAAVNAFVRGSSDIAAAVGTVQRIRPGRNFENSSSFEGSAPQLIDGYSIVKVTGDKGTGNFKVNWKADSSGNPQGISASPVAN